MKEKNKSSCASCLQANCLIKLCSPVWIKMIEEEKNEEHFQKGQSVFRAGDIVNGLFFIKRGKVKVISKGIRGKEQIVRLASGGHVLGHRGLGEETFPVRAIALNDSKICFIDNETLYRAFYSNIMLVIELMKYFAKELRAVEARMKYMAQMNVREKVASALLYLKEIFGYEMNGVTLNITISRKDIADLCGMSVEQVIRNLTYFEKVKFIAKDGKKIKIIDEKALQKMVNLYRN